jgi:hypothetical protein
MTVTIASIGVKIVAAWGVGFVLGYIGRLASKLFVR